MKTTPEALKKLYEALGGAYADVENLSLTPDIIEAIAEVAPTGGGGGVEIITLSAEEQETLMYAIKAVLTAAAAEKGVNHTFGGAGGLSETTFRKIFDLYASGKNVNLQLDFGGSPLVLTPTAHSATGSGTDASPWVSCSVFGISDGVKIDARILFVGMYNTDVEDPSGAMYEASVEVSGCIPKAAD